MLRFTSTFTICLTLAGALLAGTAFGNQLRSKTKMTPAQEVSGSGPFEPAPVAFASNGVATAVVVFDEGFSRLRIRVRFADLDGAATRLHFHCAPAGENGPVALGLVEPGPLTFGSGSVAGTLTNADFSADVCTDRIGQPVNNVASLAAAIQAGLIYWNLHTDAWPAGEVRGQVAELDKD